MGPGFGEGLGMGSDSRTRGQPGPTGPQVAGSLFPPTSPVALGPQPPSQPPIEREGPQVQDHLPDRLHPQVKEQSWGLALGARGAGTSQ